MTPRQFEECVCEYYRKQGYKADITPSSGDYGIDVFATKDKEKGKRNDKRVKPAH